MKFSIIVPVYNVDKYLPQCVESILSQTYTDFELILVDDGSTDDCPKLCDLYTKRDNRVTTVHQPNGGLSAARNQGLRCAQGDYVLFLDSDDYYSNENVLAILSDKCAEDDYDIVQFSTTKVYPDGHLIDEKFHDFNCLDSLKGIQQLKYMIKNELIVGSSCAKVIKREFLMRNNLFFTVGIKSEDIEWMLRVLPCLPKFGLLTDCFYMYRQQREGSITTTIDFKHINDYMTMIENALDGEKNEVQEVLYNYIAYHYIILCALISRLKNKKEKSIMIGRLKEYDFLFQYKWNPKVKKVSNLYHVVGYKITIFLLGKYLTMR